MPRKARELSALEVRRLTAPGRHAVGGVSGLFLRVTKSGARSWVLRYPTSERRESANGKLFTVYRDVGLGGFPDTSLARARQKAEEIRTKLSEGIDPVTEKKAARQARLEAELWMPLPSSQPCLNSWEQKLGLAAKATTRLGQ